MKEKGNKIKDKSKSENIKLGKRGILKAKNTEGINISMYKVKHKVIFKRRKISLEIVARPLAGGGC